MATITHTYKPLGKNYYLSTSSIEGMGLFAYIDLKKNELANTSHIVIRELSYADNCTIPKEDLYFRVERTPMGGYINHSYTPNCKLVYSSKIIGHVQIESYTICALTDIPKGVELTLDYRDYGFCMGSSCGGSKDDEIIFS